MGFRLFSHRDDGFLDGLVFELASGFLGLGLRFRLLESVGERIRGRRGDGFLLRLNGALDGSGDFFGFLRGDSFGFFNRDFNRDGLEVLDDGRLLDG